jgi:dimethylhistidine N-methyltransferase
MNRRQHSAALIDAAPDRLEFLEQVTAGLSKSPRTLPCKFFYDERGARLFQKICQLPEYYITRTELQILRLRSAEIAATLGSSIELIGLGTGAGTKTRILLEELNKPAAYLPIDISKEQLENSTARFRERFPELAILPICADYLEPFELPLPRPPSARSIIYFPGSTIGNFGDDGGLVIGVDLRKDPKIIERAYNDSAGVTAQFNLNLLARANRELGADFRLKNWRHDAVYNANEGRIEMYLISLVQQFAQIGESAFSFSRGEKILTEYSYKHTPEGFTRLAHDAGFVFEKLWTDNARLFGVFYFSVAN